MNLRSEIGRFGRNWRVGGARLVFKAQICLYYSTLGSRVIEKKKKVGGADATTRLTLAEELPVAAERM